VERIGLMVVSVILALVLAAPMALAESQGRAPGDATGTIVVKPGDYPGTCSFPYSLKLSGKGKMIELPSGGIILTSPGLDVTITNLEAPANQATFNITGSVHQSTLENGSVETVMTGRNFAIDPVVGTTVVIGRYTFAFDAEGNLVQHQMGHGQRIDVCELLS
jgi:hypothetical protein